MIERAIAINFGTNLHLYFAVSVIAFISSFGHVKMLLVWQFGSMIEGEKIKWIEKLNNSNFKDSN